MMLLSYVLLIVICSFNMLYKYYTLVNW